MLLLPVLCTTEASHVAERFLDLEPSSLSQSRHPHTRVNDFQITVIHNTAIGP